MKLPSEVLIRKKKWKVRVRKTLYEREKCYGLCWPDRALIEVDASLKGDELRWVFFHEYCHAMLWESGATSHDTEITDFVEEIICDAFADAMIEDKKVSFRRVRK